MFTKPKVRAYVAGEAPLTSPFAFSFKLLYLHRFFEM